MKYCTKCKILQSNDRYHKDVTKADGLCSVCKSCKKEQVRQYYIKNTTVCNAKKKLRYEKNKDDINTARRKHPGVAGRGSYNKLNPNHFDFGGSSRKASGVSNYNRLVRQYKKQAKGRNLEFELSEEDFKILVTGNCHYCGIIPSQIISDKTSNGKFVYNGIDRVDNTLGYASDNCVSCCKVCNKAKGNLSKQDWEEWIARLIAHNTPPRKV